MNAQPIFDGNCTALLGQLEEKETRLIKFLWFYSLSMFGIARGDPVQCYVKLCSGFLLVLRASFYFNRTSLILREGTADCKIGVTPKQRSHECGLSWSIGNKWFAWMSAYIATWVHGGISQADCANGSQQVWQSMFPHPALGTTIFPPLWMRLSFRDSRHYDDCGTNINLFWWWRHALWGWQQSTKHAKFWITFDETVNIRVPRTLPICCS